MEQKLLALEERIFQLEHEMREFELERQKQNSCLVQIEKVLKAIQEERLKDNTLQNPYGIQKNTYTPYYLVESPIEYFDDDTDHNFPMYKATD
jgi:hypothetical protein